MSKHTKTESRSYLKNIRNNGGSDVLKTRLTAEKYKLLDSSVTVLYVGGKNS